MELSQAGHQGDAGVVVRFISLPSLSFKLLLGEPDYYNYRETDISSNKGERVESLKEPESFEVNVIVIFPTKNLFF